MSKKDEPIRIIAYQYYCGECSKFFKYMIDFDERLNEYACPVCFNKLKYKGGCDVAISATGNCGYISAEKVSEQNIKRIGKDKYDEMVASDPISKHRKESAEEAKNMWWRKGLKDPSKPLNLNEIKDVKKYINTGEK